MADEEFIQEVDQVLKEIWKEQEEPFGSESELILSTAESEDAKAWHETVVAEG